MFNNAAVGSLVGVLKPFTHCTLMHYTLLETFIPAQLVSHHNNTRLFLLRPHFTALYVTTRPCCTRHARS
jgi:hypothetical protein